VGRAGRFLLTLLWSLFLAGQLPAPPEALGSVQGDHIIDSASILVNGTPAAMTSVTVTVVIRTSSTIQFLKYAAPQADGSLPAGATLTNVAQTFYRTGAASSAPFAAEAPPTPLGSGTPLNLNQPVPLVPATSYHAGEPIFVQVTDPDQNLDRTSRDTVLVTVTDSTTGETEVLRLTETGPDTGVFVGYLNTAESTGTTTSYSGLMPVAQGNPVSARYVDATDGSDSATAAVVVDPFGIVFDSKSGKPLDGATVTLWDVKNNVPATVYGDNGVASFPSTVVTGSVPKDSSGRSYAYPPGGFRFPFIVPGSYQLRVTPPPGYVTPSTVTDTAIAQLPGGPFSIVPGSRGESFSVNPGPSIRIDIPADAVTGKLWIQKTAGKTQVAIGDFLPYQISVQNNDSALTLPAVLVTDRMPLGFRYRKGSAKISEVPTAEPTISADGRTLTFKLGDIAAKGIVTLSYVTEISAGAAMGLATNYASAASGSITSNLASAQVQVKSDFLSSRSLILGRVYNGSCSEEGTDSKGIAGVRIFLEDGTFVDTDKNGLYHFEGVTTRAHVVQLDLDSLPEGYVAVPCEQNSRFAGRAYSQFVEMQGGTLWRADFHLARAQKQGAPGEHTVAAPQPKPEPPPAPEEPQVEAPAPEPAPPATPASVGIDLKSALSSERQVEYQVRVWGGAEKLSHKRLTITLPPGLVYLPKSSELNGKLQGDPVQKGSTLSYTLPDTSDEWIGMLRLNGEFTIAGSEGELLTKAVLSFDTPSASQLATPVAENVLTRVRSSSRLAMPDVVLHPHFPTFGTELSAEDRASLDELARMLVVLAIDRITISGHTDNVRIAPRARRIFADNKALSFGRAKSVGRYLCEKLHLPPDRMQYFGQGESQPVASNATPKGRAENRRVEIRIQAARLIEKETVELKKGQSGLQQTEIARPALPAAPAEKTVKLARPAEQEKKVAAAAEEKPEAKAAADDGQAKEPAKTVVASLDGKEPAASDADPAPADQPTIKDKEGVLSPADGSVLIYPINGVRICLSAALTPRLSVDGKEVPAERIGFTMKDTKSGKAIYSYIGVDFGKPGEHTLLVEGLDPFGNARFKQAAKLTRSGEVAAIRLKSAQGNVADGKTPVKLQLELLDGSGQVIPAAAELEIRDGELKPYKEKNAVAGADTKTGQYELVRVDAQGNVLFQPVSRTGQYHVVLAINGVKLEADTYLKPALRNWILVGLAEGTAGYNTISGHMESVQGTAIDDKFYDEGRLAFYAKGTVKGEWLMTAAYDSKKATGVTGNGLFQNIDPNTYYTLYGDAGQQQYDASSTKKLYLKIERDQFYALFGDYDTGLTTTELSRYSRKLSGVKAEFHNKNLDVVAFGSQTGQSYVKDEIQGDGTSGLYHLSRKGIVLNSDTVTIQVRDRFHSEVLISTQQLSRFTDYSIDYDSGTLLFKQPIYSRDDQFNPIYIVAEYETQDMSSNAITAGGRAGVKLLDDKVKAGFTYIHEGQVSGSGNSYGLDTTLKLFPGTTLKAEAAHTDTNFGTASSGNAYLAELAEKIGKLDAKLYYRDVATGFGLGQQQGSEVGTRKLGADAAYKLLDTVTMNGQVSRDYTLSTGAQRDLVEARGNYNAGNYGANLGFRYASDELGDGSRQTSQQLSMGANWLALDKKLNLKVSHDQSLWSSNNADYPTRTTLGADYKLTEKVSVFAEQEFTEGGSNHTNMTRAGLKSTPWSGGTVNSSMERDLNESQDRMFALFGLKQTWKIDEHWTVDAGLDRSQTIRNSYLFNVNVPPASGTATPSEDFTAVSLGAGYKQTSWSWDGRAEVRRATSEDKWGVLSSLMGEPRQGWGWSARLQLFDTQASAQDTLHGDLRFGLVYRPLETRWIILDRLDFLVDKTEGGSATVVSTSDIASGSSTTTGTVTSTTLNSNSNDRRIVNNLNANFKPNGRTQFSFQYGAKYVLETVDYSQYSGYTDLMGIEGRYDFTPKWDVGARGSLLHSWNTGQLQSSAGLSIGYNLVENAWLSVGYNFTGFTDKDFSTANYTAQGPYVRFRFKFDQNSVKDAVKWLNQ